MTIVSARPILVLAALAILASCSAPAVDTQPSSPVAPKPLASVAPATGSAGGVPRERLRRTLAALGADARLAFGHEDSMAYGVGWSGDADRSDVKGVCGDHAAVHGWDLGDIGASANLDGVPFDRMRALMLAAHRRGGVNTVSFHVDNPVSGRDAWDTTRAVFAVLPGGGQNTAFRETLGRVAAFFRSLRADDGSLVPVVFRPFHEHNGNWFWWGRDHATDAEYVALFRYTASVLRSDEGLGELLFAFSPGAGGVETEEEYLFRYPGDEYVDLFGLDHYYRNDASELVRAVEATVLAARRHGKLAALTEFGVRDGLSNTFVDTERWFTRDFLQPLLQSRVADGLSYALAWRNANTEHFFVPYPGHEAAEDFREFCARPEVLLERELRELGAGE